jgi:transposase InsO family protein
MTFADAYRAVVEFIDFYNTKRIHGSIKMSPDQFERAWNGKLPKLAGYTVSA